MDEHRFLPDGGSRHGHDVAHLLLLGLEYHRVFDVLVDDEGDDTEWSFWILRSDLWHWMGAYL